MPLQDDQTTSARAIVAEDARASVPAGDMQAILKLIATQVEDADRRHAQMLSEMVERLNGICKEARLARAKVPPAFAPALERIQEGIEQLAGLAAGDDATETAEAIASIVAVASNDSGEPAASTDSTVPVEFGEPAEIAGADVGELITEQAPQFLEEALGEADDEFLGAAREPLDEDRDRQIYALISDMFPPADPVSEQDDIPTEESADDMLITDNVITDNAADRADLPSHDQRDGFGASIPSLVKESAPVAADVSVKPANDDQLEPPVPASVAGDQEQPWDHESAEALTRIYESGEAGLTKLPAMLPGMLPEVPDAALAATDALHLGLDQLANVEPALESEEEYDEVFEDDAEMSAVGAKVLAAQADSADVAPETGASVDTSRLNDVQPIEQAWLADRFAEIAIKIEEAMAALREDEMLQDLSSRFGEFEERVGTALEDVATRQDIDALMAVEAQIDSMVGYFGRIEAQFGRIDTLESQLECIIERISDDHLSQHFSQQHEAAQADYANLAENAAENVARRFLADFSAGGDNAGITEIRESLEAFMAERREHDANSAGMLDTVQQALIRVLDRVETMEDGSVNSPMTSPVGFDPAELTPEDMARMFEPESFDEEDDAQQKQAEPANSQSGPQDYQRRLDYPAAVMGLSDPDEAEPFQQVAEQQPQPSGEAQQQPFDNNGSLPYADESAVPQDLDAGEVAVEPLAPDFEPADDTSDLTPMSAIDRLRQEFIADAKRARQNAAQQSANETQQQPKLTSLTSKFGVPKLSSLGLSLGGAKSEAQPEPQPELQYETTDQTSVFDAAPVEGEVATETSRFTVTRSKILIGAMIVLFATAGALLMMRGKSEPSDIAPPAQIEQTIDGGTSGPELMNPQQAAPAEEGRQGSLEGGRVYDGEFNYDVAPQQNGKPFASAPAGIALTGLDKEADAIALTKARRSQAMAKMSSDLGIAAAYATPASLIPDQVQPQSVELNTGSVAKSSKGQHLDLPPASVGPLSLRLAAAKGDPSAQFEVAARLASATGAAQDLKAAVQWYKLSAAQGFAQSQYRIGTLYERGVGVKKDLARASIWYERAAAKGNIKAMHNLAVVTAARHKGKPNYAAAAKWFEKAAQHGLSDSQYNMAVLHESGLGVNKDLGRAFYYYALAAAAGDEQAADRRNVVRAKLSPGDITTIERQIEVFRPTRTDRIVNDARVAGDDWKKRADHKY